MTTDLESAPPTQIDDRRRRGVRVLVFVGYLAVLLVTVVTLGLPTDRLYQAVWIVAGIIAFRIDRPWREHLRVVLDWSPLIAALLIYDVSRGVAEKLGMPVRVAGLADTERFIFGGTVPTVWLQEHLRPDGQDPWWTVLTGIVYSTHFIVPWLLAAIFYVYSRPVWMRYMRRVLLLSYLGLVTYILLPTAPPWYASQEGIIGPVRRAAGFGLAIVPMDESTRWLEAQSNDVAAMPSLHSAFALLVVIAIWPYARYRWVKALLVLFPLAMTFTLVYGGEHYVVDVLAGWAYLGVAILLSRVWENYRSQHTARVA